MGGLFSTEEPRPTYPQFQGAISYEAESIRRYPHYERQYPSTPKPKPPSGRIYPTCSHTKVLQPSRLRVTTNEPTTDLKKFIRTINSWNYSSGVFNLTPLPDFDQEYITIKQLFTSTTKKTLVQIIAIHKIENPYLMGRYMLKKQQYIATYGHVNEEFLFHGTNSKNMNEICESNFNWRLCGNKIGHRFGQGVSFSPISYYASNYCDKKNVTKEMLVANVLVAKECIGEENMKIPPYINSRRNLRYDTTIKEDRRVIVKYDDDEYYPAYKISFTVKYGYYFNNNKKNGY